MMCPCLSVSVWRRAGPMTPGSHALSASPCSTRPPARICLSSSLTVPPLTAGWAGPLHQPAWWIYISKKPLILDLDYYSRSSIFTVCSLIWIAISQNNPMLFPARINPLRDSAAALMHTAHGVAHCEASVRLDTRRDRATCCRGLLLSSICKNIGIHEAAIQMQPSTWSFFPHIFQIHAPWQNHQRTDLSVTIILHL
jgi:hypothetical protein